MKHADGVNGRAPRRARSEKSNAFARGRLAGAIVEERLRLIGVPTLELRTDLIGVDALHGPRTGEGGDPYEVRLRVVARTATQADAWRVAREHNGSPIRLVLTDVIMPLMSGKDMADWLKMNYPDVKILFTCCELV